MYRKRFGLHRKLPILTMIQHANGGNGTGENEHSGFSPCGRMVQLFSGPEGKSRPAPAVE